MVKDDALEGYVAAIEGHLKARRGADHILSPRDFGLVRAWHRAGVSLATVLVGIDRAFDDGNDVTSLAFCRRRVEELVASGAPRLRPTPAVESVPLDELREILQSLLDHLAPLRPGPSACFEPPLRKILEVRDLLSVTSRPNWDYLRGKLHEIDEDVSAAVLQYLPPADLAALRQEASRAAARHHGRVDASALEDAQQRYTVQRARERLGLPRVSLV